MAGKTHRLSKVASTLNVSIPTIVEFLADKGVEIESNPNAKIEDEQFEMLNKAFAADISLKEKVQNTTIKKTVHQTISIEDNKKKEEPIIREEEETIDIEKLKNIPVEIPRPAMTTGQSATKEEDKDAKEEVNQTPKDSQENDKPNTPHVLGKIDVSSYERRDARSKKKAPKTSPKKDEKVNKTEPKITIIAKEEPKPIIEKPIIKEEKKEVEKTVAPMPPVKEEIETIRVETKKITGPTILGKIELPVEKYKVASSSHDPNKNKDKKKRKRIQRPGTQHPTATNQRPNSGNNTTGNRGKKGNTHTPHEPVSDKDIEKEIKETLARLSSKGSKSKGAKLRRERRASFAQQREKEQLEAEEQEKILKLTEFVTVSELASLMNVQATQVISTCMSLGIFVSINQRLDAETIQIVADEYGYETNFVSTELTESIPIEEDKEEDLLPRPAIVTVMGHVDHGKTSLLDRIRNADVTSTEAGGITQHIGAYSVKIKNGRVLTFLDTPGHEAFTAMRARGAQITDVAIIIIAADDSVMPQTKEAISHAQAAGVPMVFAINKVDKDGANPDRIREQLSEMNILVEEWGGKYQCQEISAKKGLNIEELLEKVVLEADMLNLKANPNKNAVGAVIEASLDKGKGYITNILVQEGTLHVGDVILAGSHYGRVRAMIDERGNRVEEVKPSQPISILGLNGAPSAGDKFYVLDDEKEAKNIASKRGQLHREQGIRTSKHITLDEIGRRLAIGDFKELNLIVKGDMDGSIEALSDSLLELSTEEIAVRIIHKGIGAITEADVNLALASDAIIVGFQVRPTAASKKLADEEKIDIRLYSVIYKAIEEIKSAMEGMLSPEIQEQITGSAEIREIFKISKVGTIAGCFVLDGVIKRTSKVRVIRDGIVVHTGTLGSLKRFKDDQREVKKGYECGLNLDKYNEIEVGDIIEAFEEIEVARKL